MSNDKTAQGCLFYIFATGHKAIEFALKSNRRLFKWNEYSSPRFRKDKKIIIKSCGECDNNLFLYDGAVFLKSKEEKDVQDAIKDVNNLVDYFKQKGIEIEYRLKYQLYVTAPSKKEKNEDGTFSITFSMDDPRNTLVASSLDMFPKSDWRIKEEWI